MTSIRLLILGTALLTALSTLPAPTASALPNGCAVGPGDDTCTFLCTSGFVTVTAFGGSAGAVITGTCGIGGATCFAPPGGFCTARAPSLGVRGLCVLDDLDDPPLADAFGFCSG